MSVFLWGASKFPGLRPRYLGGGEGYLGSLRGHCFSVIGTLLLAEHSEPDSLAICPLPLEYTKSTMETTRCCFYL